jgi:hypothetical protein
VCKLKWLEVGKVRATGGKGVAYKSMPQVSLPTLRPSIGLALCTITKQEVLGFAHCLSVNSPHSQRPPPSYAQAPRQPLYHHPATPVSRFFDTTLYVPGLWSIG